MSMLDFDGITVVDNCGRIRGYNIFVETDNKRNKCIVGGARKRAVYTILNSRRKHLVGVYFQSHEGEIFYKSNFLYKPSYTFNGGYFVELDNPNNYDDLYVFTGVNFYQLAGNSYNLIHDYIVIGV